jgi:hypothetical protein
VILAESPKLTTRTTSPISKPRVQFHTGWVLVRLGKREFKIISTETRAPEACTMLAVLKVGEEIAVTWATYVNDRLTMTWS